MDGKQIDAEEMRKVAEVIRASLPKGLGFCLITFETGTSDTPSNYISNCEREDMIKHLRETAETLEKNREFNTPEPGSTLKCVDCELKLPDTFAIRSIGCPNCGGVLM